MQLKERSMQSSEIQAAIMDDKLEHSCPNVNKCLNCHTSTYILQHLLVQANQSKSSGDDSYSSPDPQVCLEVLFYILGIDMKGEEASILRSVNGSNWTFCKECLELLTRIYIWKRDFIKKTSAESYLWNNVLKSSRRVTTMRKRAETSCSSNTQSKVAGNAGNTNKAGSPEKGLNLLKKYLENPTNYSVEEGASTAVPQSQPGKSVIELDDDNDIEIVEESVKHVGAGPAPNSKHLRSGRSGSASSGLREGKKYKRPPYSATQLISQALASAANRTLTIIEIYSYIARNYQFYHSNQDWHGAIKRALHWRSYFLEVSQSSSSDYSRRALWKINPEYEAKLVEAAFQPQKQLEISDKGVKLPGKPPDTLPGPPDSEIGNTDFKAVPSAPIIKSSITIIKNPYVNRFRSDTVDTNAEVRTNQEVEEDSDSVCSVSEAEGPPSKLRRVSTASKELNKESNSKAESEESVENNYKKKEPAQIPGLDLVNTEVAAREDLESGSGSLELELEPISSDEEVFSSDESEKKKTVKRLKRTCKNDQRESVKPARLQNSDSGQRHTSPRPIEPNENMLGLDELEAVSSDEREMPDDKRTPEPSRSEPKSSPDKKSISAIGHYRASSPSQNTNYHVCNSCGRSRCDIVISTATQCDETVGVPKKSVSIQVDDETVYVPKQSVSTQCDDDESEPAIIKNSASTQTDTDCDDIKEPIIKNSVSTQCYMHECTFQRTMSTQCETKVLRSKEVMCRASEVPCWYQAKATQTRRSIPRQDKQITVTPTPAKPVKRNADVGNCDVQSDDDVQIIENPVISIRKDLFESSSSNNTVNGIPFTSSSQLQQPVPAPVVSVLESALSISSGITVRLPDGSLWPISTSQQQEIPLQSHPRNVAPQGVVRITNPGVPTPTAMRTSNPVATPSYNSATASSIPDSILYLNSITSTAVAFLIGKSKELYTAVRLLQKKDIELEGRIKANSAFPDAAMIMLELLNVTNLITEISKNFYLSMDASLTRIRLVMPKDQTFTTIKTYTVCKSLAVDVLAKYFKQLLIIEEWLPQAVFENYFVVLELLKFKITRLVRHFVSSACSISSNSELSQQQTPNNTGCTINETYFFNICNCLKCKAPAAAAQTPSSSSENAQTGLQEECWSMPKAIKVWDQIRTFNHPISIEIVNLDHNEFGVEGFQRRLDNIQNVVLRRRR